MESDQPGADAAAANQPDGRSGSGNDRLALPGEAARATYPSAAAVADDLERFIRREPILARPVSRWEQLGRWCPRNPKLATLAGALVLTNLAGSGTAFWQWNRGEHANVKLTESVAHLQWGAIDDMMQAGPSSRALAKVASLLRDTPANWKAAMFGMSVIDDRRFPAPAAPAIGIPTAPN